MDFLAYPIKHVTSFANGGYARDQEETQNKSKLVSEAADSVFKFHRVTQASAYPNGVATATGPDQASLFGTAHCASVAVQGLNQCDPQYKRLVEMLEDPKGKYNLALGTAKTVTKTLNQYWRNEGMQIGTTFVGLPEPREISLYLEGSGGGDWEN
jgi:hypothetical protein